MANTVNITTVNSSDRNLVLHIYLASDGSGELADEVLIDPISLGLAKDTRFAIEDIAYNFSGFSARVEFDTGLVEDKQIWVLGVNNSIANFDKIGGLFDRSGLDGTGRIQLTTTGFDAGEEGSIVICIRKGGILST